MSAFLRTAWEDKKVLVWVILGVLAIVLATYLYFQFKRSWNYTLGYESRVQATVCEMVQVEHLTAKGKEICD